MNALRTARGLVKRKGFTLCENSNRQLSLFYSALSARKASTRKVNRAAKTRNAAINNSNNRAAKPVHLVKLVNIAGRLQAHHKVRIIRPTQARRIRANRAAAVRNQAAAARRAKVPAETAKARRRAARLRRRAVHIRANRLLLRTRRRAVRTMRLSPTLRQRAGYRRKVRRRANRQHHLRKERRVADRKSVV